MVGELACFNDPESYANNAVDGSKEELYEQLQQEVEAPPRHDVVIVMGDLNAKIGEDNEGWMWK